MCKNNHNKKQIHLLLITFIFAVMTGCAPQDNQKMENSNNIQLNLTDDAAANCNTLWTNEASKLATTDPELVEFFNNFAFDDVAKQITIDNKTRVMATMASCIAQGALTEFKNFVNAALNIGITPVEVKEIVYQAVPYVGMAKVVDFVSATNDIFTERGIQLPLEGQSTTTRETRFDKGLAAQKGIFGPVIDHMRANAPEGQVHIQDNLSANCFGDYYTRNGLDIKTREMLTFSMLISMGGTDGQVRGHIAGNLAVGNDKETLISVATALLPYIGYPRTLNAIAAINEITNQSKK